MSEEGGLYTVAGQQNSHQDGQNVIKTTKADAAALLESTIVIMRNAGWQVELRNDNHAGAAYIVIPKSNWASVDGKIRLEEV